MSDDQSLGADLGSNANLTQAKLMQEFCRYLIAMREQSPYDLGRAAMATRISRPFIDALEAGDFAKLPGHIFARGFLKSLSKIYVGDVDSELMSKFDLLADMTGFKANLVGFPVDEPQGYLPPPSPRIRMLTLKSFCDSKFANFVMQRGVRSVLFCVVAVVPIGYFLTHLPIDRELEAELPLDRVINPQLAASGDISEQSSESKELAVMERDAPNAGQQPRSAPTRQLESQDLRSMDEIVSVSDWEAVGSPSLYYFDPKGLGRGPSDTDSSKKDPKLKKWSQRKAKGPPGETSL